MFPALYSIFSLAVFELKTTRLFIINNSTNGKHTMAAITQREYLTNKKIKYIAHVSDIHIGSRPDRYKEYSNVLEIFAQQMMNFTHKDELLIVITGDTCHWKSRLAPEDILCFDRFITLLYPLPVLIIPGNHDAVINNKNREDLMTPLVSRYKHVIYSKNTESFTVGGLPFFHISIYDSREESEIFDDLEKQAVALAKISPPMVYDASDSASVDKILENKIRGYDPENKLALPIILYHGFVDGAKLGSHVVSGCKISKRIMNTSRLTLIGDIHEMQFVLPNAAYPGSLIQQNVAESLEKGFILWHVEKNKGRFIPIPNQRVMIRVDYREGKEGAAIYGRLTSGMDAQSKELFRKNITRVTIITESYGAALENQIHEVKNIFGRLDNISTVDNGLSTRSNTVHSAGTELDISDAKMNNADNRDNTAAAAVNDVANMVSARLSPLETQIETIKQLLVEKADSVISSLSLPEFASEEARNAKILDIMNKVIALHRSHVSDMPVRRWTVKSMRWDNILIYGEGNFIDFEEISKMGKSNGSNSAGVITGCIAPNRSGKSSIFDILVYALFGSHLRGDSKSIFHKGSRDLHFRVDFEVNGVDYYIERYDSATKQSSAKLYKINPRDRNKQEDITAETIPQTYAKITSLIGTLDDFLATGLFYDNENDIIRLSKTARRETLSRLFGLVDNERIIKEERKKIKDLAATLQSIENKLKARSEKSATGVDFSVDISQVNARSNSMKTQLVDAENKRAILRSNYQKMDAEWYSINAEITEIKQYDSAMQSLNTLMNMDTQVLQKKDARMRELKTLIERRIVELPKGIRAFSANERPMTETEQNVFISILAESPDAPISSMSAAELLAGARSGEIVTLIKSQLTTASAELNAVTAHLTKLFGGNPPTEAGAAVEKEKLRLAACSKQLADDEAAEIACSKLVAQFREGVEGVNEVTTSAVSALHSKLLADILAAERSKNALNIDKISMELAKARATESAAAQRTKYGFAPDCGNCKKNIDLLSADLSIAQKEVARVQSHYTEILAKSTEIAAQITEMETARIAAEKLLGALKKHDAAVEAIKEIKISMAAIEEKIAALETSATEFSKKNVLNARVNKLRDQMAAAEALHNDYARKQYMLTREEIDLTVDLPQLRANVTKTQEKITEYKIKIQSLHALTQKLSEISSTRNTMQTQISQQDELIGQLKLLIDEMDEFVELKNEYDTLTPRLREDIELHSAYVSLLGAKGLQTQVIKRNINSVIAKINAVLTSITTFRIAMEVSDTKINLFISDSVAGDLTRDIPIELASGFQKFVISLIFRLSLTHSLFTASKFVICDESFSTFDQANLSHVPELLNAVKGFYDFVFIISHIELLQQCVEVPIYINVEERIEVANNATAANTSAAKKETRGRKLKDLQTGGGGSSAVSIITSYIRSPEGSDPSVLRPYTIAAQNVTAEDSEKEKATEKIKCACGAEIQRKSMEKHATSARHVKYTEKQNKAEKNAALVKK